MSFGIRLAPGVRLSASSRGLRMGAGPRIARIHVGGGRTGFSSGLGPFSYYTSTGGRRRSGHAAHSGGRGRAAPRSGYRAAGGGTTRTQLAELQRQARRQAAEDAYQALVTLEWRLMTLHAENFPVTVTPPDLGPEVVDRAELLTMSEQRELAPLGRFERQARREAARPSRSRRRRRGRVESAGRYLRHSAGPRARRLERPGRQRSRCRPRCARSGLRRQRVGRRSDQLRAVGGRRARQHRRPRRHTR